MQVDIENRVKKVMAEIFALPVDQVGPQLSVKTSSLWDSAHHINLVLALEHEFGTRLPDEVVVKMSDFEAVLQSINQSINQSGRLK
jgi:acyl carrier protein